MTKRQHSNKIPKNMQSDYDEITELTNSFCNEFLDQDYQQLTQYATAALCRKKPSPLLNGRKTTWAAAVIHAIGTANSLFDQNTKPYVSFNDMANYFDLAKSTIGNKSKQVRDMLKIRHFDHHWCLPSKIKNNTSAWMIMCDGFIVDARTLAPKIQEIAYEKGLIPYIHAYETEN